ncbi:MAG: hypothetical protein QF921_00990 [Pseudomonadales bacterium]|mgnify:CR=1 FL=1|jgi:hypothetical protein|nr:hypothetical protein [Pseudomonadales bacterium]MDP6471349.1 hypothetical protein [Pseudomonadales bacterium]MDP6826460.1 hypothetical protein [Pseudomonadales bacterium]MDP6970085.1 hypothetical protein [Pseudomonadales bacterium]|tara:strand:+ start:1261 stop:2823 length:1563 start_codon:yes stop_codon:yes gene_type:complete
MSWRLLIACWLACAPVLHAATLADQLVFGSFQKEQKARDWAQRVQRKVGAEVRVAELSDGETTWYRVVSDPDPQIARQAASQGLTFWRNPVSVDDSAEPGRRVAERSVQPTSTTIELLGQRAPARQPQAEALSPQSVSQLDFDLGFQGRSFPHSGYIGQERFHPSFSVQLEYYRAWEDDRRSFTFTPFFRYDIEDSERTHGDIRELFYTHVGDDWDLHVGVRRLFWGVSEFQHLVDIVNQTDLVENVDGEDKLGQPMVQLSLVRDWGIVDLFALTGFRERTFAGDQGRLNVLPIDTDDATYESSAEELRTDAAVRWSHFWGPLEFGVYHFSGTSRDPLLIPTPDGSGGLLYRPHYPVIDQTGFDAQAIAGDWAWKLEAISRSGYDDRYVAAVAGFERTLVGVFGTRSDLGLVVEYMFDDRGDRAFNTLFENDVALGARWRANDLADTEALLGLIWDTDSEEYVFSLEASRRLGDNWGLYLEGRVFGGGDDIALPYLLDPDNKSAALQRDDYIQLELKRFF